MKKDRALTPTKQKILNCAASLFAEKGYTETSIRELAATAGLQGSSIYNHFKNKIAILDFMLEDYEIFNSGLFSDKTVRATLYNNPTTDGILLCLQTRFPEGMEDYYFKVLSMVLQEQHRNPVVKSHIQEIILVAERRFGMIMSILKDVNVIRRDADPDFWSKMVSSIFYTFANRAVLGIGDDSPGFSGMNMVALLRRVCDMMFMEHGAANTGARG
jgi:AcrR family transcriptional regulator